MNKEDQLKKLTEYIKPSVAYIVSTDGKSHDIVEDFPEDAPDVFFEMGWRVVNDTLLSPDEYRDFERGKLKL